MLQHSVLKNKNKQKTFQVYMYSTVEVLLKGAER